MACISAASFAMMVNGGPSFFFKAFRGFRQGDPPSPILFITVLEVFSRLMDRAGELNLFSGISVNRGEDRVLVSHLFFADDALIFCNPDLSSLLYLRCIFLCFKLVSGLRINMMKSEIGYNWG